MAGRPKTFDLDDAIRKATQVFWQKGYEASSTEELLDAMGIGKGSFYLHFKEGKKELYERSLSLFSDDALANFRKNMSAFDSELDFLRSFLLKPAQSNHETKQKGCYLGNGVVEMSNIDSKMKDHAAALLHRLEKAFENILANAQKTGELKNRTSAKILAKYLINLRNGANVTMRMESDNKALRQVIEIGLSVID